MFGCVDLQAKDQAEGAWVMPLFAVDVTGIGRQDWQEDAAPHQEPRECRLELMTRSFNLEIPPRSRFTKGGGLR
jgi:hypothetical protein